MRPNVVACFFRFHSKAEVEQRFCEPHIHHSSRIILEQSLFYSSSLLDPVDDPNAVHRIYRPDCGSLPANTSSLDLQSTGTLNP